MLIGSPAHREEWAPKREPVNVQKIFAVIAIILVLTGSSPLLPPSWVALVVSHMVIISTCTQQLDSE